MELFAIRPEIRFGPDALAALEELAGKARFSQHILTGEERDRALERLAAERRRVREALPGWKKPLFWLFWGSE